MLKLTAAKLKSITEPGRYGDGDGLYLNVATGGSKSWVQRIVIHGKRRDVGLGSYPAISLAQARRKAAENRVAVADGRDPLAEKHRAKTPTFREAAEKVYELNKPRWKNAKHTISWRQTLEKDAMPIIGDMRVNKIGREEVLRILTPIWTTKPETARRVRQRIRTIMRWAQAHGFIEHNPAGEAIDGALPSMPKIKAHFRALPYREVPEALRIIEASTASPASKLCLRFLILCAARSGEARNAEWSEIDIKERTWTIPAEKMKANAEHRVPLSDAAVEVLERARALDDGSGLVFPSPLREGHPMSDMTLTVLLRKNGLAGLTTVHGFRSAFRDWAAENTNSPHAVMELALAHAVGSSVEQAYARSDLLSKRRVLMARWSDFLTSSSAKVIKLHG